MECHAGIAARLSPEERPSRGVSADGAVVIGEAGRNHTVARSRFEDGRKRDSSLARFGGSNVRGGAFCRGAQVRPGRVVHARGFRWSQTRGTIGLGRFGTGSNATSSGTAISANGDVIGGAGHPVLAGAIVWQADNSATIGGNPQGDSAGVVTGLSADGSVAVGASVDANNHARAFRWSVGARLPFCARESIHCDLRETTIG